MGLNHLKKMKAVRSIHTWIARISIASTTLGLDIPTIVITISEVLKKSETTGTRKNKTNACAECDCCESVVLNAEECKNCCGCDAGEICGINILNHRGEEVIDDAGANSGSCPRAEDDRCKEEELLCKP